MSDEVKLFSQIIADEMEKIINGWIAEEKKEGRTIKVISVSVFPGRLWYNMLVAYSKE